MNRLRPLLFLSALATAAGAADESGPGNELPCEPSRACAIEMARAAAYESDRRNKGNLGLFYGLFAIAELQLDSGDLAGFSATAAELRPVIDARTAYPDGLDSLAGLLGRAGRFDEALDAAADARSTFEREMAYRRVAEELARVGRWREAVAARTVSHHGHASSANFMVMRDLLRTGRLDWVMDAMPTLAPDREAELLSEFERLKGNLAASLDHAARVEDRERRWNQVLELVKASTESGRWEDLAAVARFAASEGLRDEAVRQHRLQYAGEWLCAAGHFDEALALVPQAERSMQQYLLAMIASSLAAAKQPKRALGLLSSLDDEPKADVEKEIAIARVLAGEQRFEGALAVFPDPKGRLATLRTWGEKLPDARKKEVRAVLRAAVKAAEHPDIEYADAELAEVFELQARRGFFQDARATAARIERRGDDKRAIYLAILHAGMVKAQVLHGDSAGARKTLVLLEASLREPEVNGHLHAQIINDLTSVGLLQEAFEQAKALSRRADVDWYDGEVTPLIRAYVETDQLRRAFEIAAMLSERKLGKPYYFLEIAKALPP